VSIHTFYCPDMDAPGQCSPSATKPHLVRGALLHAKLPVVIHRPTPVTDADFELAHNAEFVADILSLRQPNGFGTKSAQVASTLPYTTGAMLSAAYAALFGSTIGYPTAALCSGFHHAGYDFAGGFCTFNGLMVTAMRLLTVRPGPFTGPTVERVAIIDADYHYGNGTDDIIDRCWENLLAARLGPDAPPTALPIFHYTFGAHFTTPRDASAYLKAMRDLERKLASFKPDIVLYQAGADAHRDDPLGGVLSTEEMFERDRILFSITKKLGIPVAWNLAGGYQEEADGSIPKVIEIHLNTFRAALAAYGETP